MSPHAHPWISEVLIDIVAFAKLHGLKRLAADLVEVLESHEEIRAPRRSIRPEAGQVSIWTTPEGTVVTHLPEPHLAPMPTAAVHFLPTAARDPNGP